MASDRPQSPFAGKFDFSERPPVRTLSPDEITRQLAEHRLYLETEWRQGHRANFAAADLTGHDFSRLNLRGIKMDRALLKGADFIGTRLQRANLIGAILKKARLDEADLSGARLSGANLVLASLENACLAKAEMEFAVMAKAVLPGACLRGADLSGVLLDGAVLIRADLREANLRGAGLRDARLDGTDLRMRVWVARFLSGPRCAPPICAGPTCVWQGSMAPICPTPISAEPKACRRRKSIGHAATAPQGCPKV